MMGGSKYIFHWLLIFKFIYHKNYILAYSLGLDQIKVFHGWKCLFHKKKLAASSIDFPLMEGLYQSSL